MSIKKIITIGLTPTEIASEFAQMGSEEQAIFFNELANITARWSVPFCFQLQHITNEPCLTTEARKLMKQIGDYSDVNSGKAK